MNWLVILFVVPTIIFGFATASQILRMHKLRSSQDVSLWFTGLMVVGIGFTFVLPVIAGASFWVKLERFLSVINMLCLLGDVIYWRMKGANS